MHLLYIVMLIEHFHELQHLLSRLFLQPDRILGDKGDLREGGLDFRVGKGFFHGLEVVRIGEDFKTLLHRLHVFRSRFKGQGQ